MPPSFLQIAFSDPGVREKPQFLLGFTSDQEITSDFLLASILREAVVRDLDIFGLYTMITVRSVSPTSWVVTYRRPLGTKDWMSSLEFAQKLASGDIDPEDV